MQNIKIIDITSKNANEKFEKFIKGNLDLFQNMNSDKSLGFSKNGEIYFHQKKFFNLLLFNFSIIELIEIAQQNQIKIEKIGDEKFIKINF